MRNIEKITEEIKKTQGQIQELRNKLEGLGAEMRGALEALMSGTVPMGKRRRSLMAPLPPRPADTEGYFEEIMAALKKSKKPLLVTEVRKIVRRDTTATSQRCAALVAQGRLRVVSTGGPSGKGRTYALARSKKAKKVKAEGLVERHGDLVLEVLKKSPGMKLADIAKNVGRASSTVGKTLRVLKDSGAVEADLDQGVAHKRAQLWRVA